MNGNRFRDDVGGRAKTLCAVMTELLGVEVAPEDSFFDLGGDSLLVVDMVRSARSAGLHVKTADVFDHPTPAGLAQAVSGSGQGAQVADQPLRAPVTAEQAWRNYSSTWASTAPRCAIPLVPDGKGEPLFVVHWGIGNVSFVAEVAAQWGAGRPVYGFEAAGYRGAVKPLLSIRDMAERYLIELREIQPRGPYFLAGLCHGGVVAIEMARRLQALGEQVELVALINISSLEPFVDRGWGLDEITRYRMESLRTRYGLRSPADLPRVLREMRVDAWYEEDTRPEEIYRLQLLWSALVFSLHHFEPRPYDGRVVMFHESSSAEGIKKNWVPVLSNVEIHWFDHSVKTLLPVMRHGDVAEILRAELRRKPE
jgi:thioesterase domain-containing protein/aryl carrier-like protein